MIAVALLALALYVPGTLYPASDLTHVVFRVAVCLAVAQGVAWPQGRLVRWGIGLWAVGITASVILAPDPWRALWSTHNRQEGAWQAAHYIALLLVAARAPRERLVRWLAVAAAATAAWGVADLGWVNGRLAGAAGNPLYLAPLLLMGVWAAYRAGEGRQPMLGYVDSPGVWSGAPGSPWGGWAWHVLAAALALAAASTGSKGVVVALVAAAGVLLLDSSWYHTCYGNITRVLGGLFRRRGLRQSERAPLAGDGNADREERHGDAGGDDAPLGRIHRQGRAPEADPQRVLALEGAGARGRGRASRHGSLSPSQEKEGNQGASRSTHAPAWQDREGTRSAGRAGIPYLGLGLAIVVALGIWLVPIPASGLIRLELGRVALQGIAAAPWGWGAEGFPFVWDEWWRGTTATGEVWHDRAHSLILDRAIEWGVVGVAGWLAVVVAAWRRAELPERMAIAAYLGYGLTMFEMVWGAAGFAVLLGYSLRGRRWFACTTRTLRAFGCMYATLAVVVGSAQLAQSRAAARAPDMPTMEAAIDLWSPVGGDVIELYLKAPQTAETLRWAAERVETRSPHATQQAMLLAIWDRAHCLDLRLAAPRRPDARELCGPPFFP